MPTQQTSRIVNISTDFPRCVIHELRALPSVLSAESAALREEYDDHYDAAVRISTVEKPQKIDALKKRLHELFESLGNLLVDGFHYLALFAIGGAIVWSAVFAFLAMASKGQASIEDILLLFIYLELGAMVGIYFKTNHMPVRFLIYVGITALTRMLVGDIQAHHEPDLRILYVTGAILLLAIANLVIRYGSSKFPAPTTKGESEL